MRRLALLLPLVSLLGLAVACGQVQGEPSGADGIGARTGAPSAPASESSSPSESTTQPPAAADPCGLLSPAERSTAGLTSPGEPKSIGGAQACDYTETGSHGVTITLDETSGLDELRTGENESAEELRIGTHDALRVADAEADDGTCAVLLAAGESASVHVDVSNTNFTGTAEACTRADTVAELIEPKLPGGLS
ncbi:DUF3558 family protein [Prauserella cavernicola]|uniref:DUF3558 family protein n=1 Tax=Prauserella cavernicola TaxID=2800127 RepID=A0A934V4Q6_9PSEU|nr:DUF3558 family protein [Prauserella cavernicola]MBK1788621.1 DUF3558 family protein [Prauserella cavernicola]